MSSVSQTLIVFDRNWSMIFTRFWTIRADMRLLIPISMERKLKRCLGPFCLVILNSEKVIANGLSWKELKRRELMV